MDDIVILLLIVQALTTAVGAYFLARQARSLETAIAQASAIGFLLPFAFYMIPYSMNPTVEGMITFFEWMIYSIIANEIAGIPVAIISQLLRNN